MPIHCYRNPHMTVNSYGAIGIKRIWKGMTYQAEHALNVLVGFMAIFVSVVKTTLSLELWPLTRLTSLLLSVRQPQWLLTMAGLGISGQLHTFCSQRNSETRMKIWCHKSDLSPRELEELQLPWVPAKHCVQDSQSFCYENTMINSSSETLSSTRYLISTVINFQANIS